MLMGPPTVICHRDVVGFMWKGQFVTGKVVEIGTQRQHPENKTNSIFWMITIQPLCGERLCGVFKSNEKLSIIVMDDDENPARTRNNRSNWESLGIEEVNTCYIVHEPITEPKQTPQKGDKLYRCQGVEIEVVTFIEESFSDGATIPTWVIDRNGFRPYSRCSVGMYFRTEKEALQNELNEAEQGLIQQLKQIEEHKGYVAETVAMIAKLKEKLNS